MKWLIKTIKYLFRKFVLKEKYFIGYDLGSLDGDCSVTMRVDKKGVMHVEDLNQL